MNEEQLAQLILAAEQGDLQSIQMLGLILQLNPDAIQPLMQFALQLNASNVLQMLLQYASSTLGTSSMRNGGILNYIKFLRGQCPEGEEMLVYKKGGAICKKCVKKKKMEEGGKNPVDAFKCGRKMKKKACGGQIKK